MSDNGSLFSRWAYLLYEMGETGKPVLYRLSERGEPDDVELVKLILERGASPNTQTFKGKTPLYVASQNNHTDIVKLLLDAGADVNKAETTYGFTPLYIASEKGFTGMARILIDAGADVNKATTTPWFGTDQGFGTDDVTPRWSWREEDVAPGATPLYIASEKGFADVVRILIDAGADVNKATTDYIETPLLMASFKRWSPVVRMLIDAGADVNKGITFGDNENSIPLICASEWGFDDVTRMLIDAGADVNKADNSGSTPLLNATERARNREWRDVMRMMIDAGADVNKADNSDSTPLMRAALLRSDKDSLQVCMLLASSGAYLWPRDDEEWTAAALAEYQNNVKTSEWLESVADFTPVQICVSLGNGDRLKALLRKQEIDPFARSEGTPTLSELAAGNQPMLKLCREIRMGWAPTRHHLFHPAHRSTVYLVMLVVLLINRTRQYSTIYLPTEIWYLIFENMGRMNWPEDGRKTILL